MVKKTKKLTKNIVKTCLCNCKNCDCKKTEKLESIERIEIELNI